MKTFGNNTHHLYDTPQVFLNEMNELALVKGFQHRVVEKKWSKKSARRILVEGF